MVSCPFCSNNLLRHIGHGDIYWFCPHCWQELPNIQGLIERQNENTPELAVLIPSHDDAA